MKRSIFNLVFESVMRQAGVVLEEEDHGKIELPQDVANGLEQVRAELGKVKSKIDDETVDEKYLGGCYWAL